MSNCSARLHLVATCATITMALFTSSPTWSAESCSAQSPVNATPVVELYTSEGCNSCPPADRWLSKLKGEPDVVALAFHVDYWDRLGWKDRFASPAYTQRQALQQQSNGARFSYTPQVVIDGVDRPRWHAVDAAAAARGRATSHVDIQLAREGRSITATVSARAGAPARLAAYWAVTENDHSTPVKAGENEGVLLRHDFVVRRYVTVPAWNAAGAAPAALRLDADASGTPAPGSFVNLVVFDAATQRPVQALRLGC